MYMKKRALLIMVILLVLGILPHAQAADADSSFADTVASMEPQEDAVTPQKSWSIALSGRVVANQGSSLAVYLNSPQNMAVDEGDSADHLQILPIVRETSVVDDQGRYFLLDDLLPGQEVRVTFQYHWRSGTPRSVQMEKCLQVELKGTPLTRGSTATVDDFQEGVLVGTVLSTGPRQLELFVESGRAFSGDTEYQVNGVRRMTVPAGAQVVDESGKAVALSAVKVFDRVAVAVGEAVWMESYPPSYAPQSASKVQVLAQGEKIISPAELSGREVMDCTVLRLQTDAGGNRQLVVRPDEGGRERGLSEELVVHSAMGQIYGAGGQLMEFDAIAVGMHLEIRYTGLRHGETGFAIPWYNQIRVTG